MNTFSTPSPDTAQISWTTSSGHRVILDPWQPATAHAVPKGACYSSTMKLLDKDMRLESSGFIAMVIVETAGEIRASVYARLCGCEPTEVGDAKKKGIMVWDTLFDRKRETYPASSEGLIQKLQEDAVLQCRKAIECLPLLPEFNDRITYPSDVMELEKNQPRTLKEEYVPEALARLSRKKSDESR